MKHRLIGLLMLLTLALASEAQAQHSSWVAWTEEPTIGDTCTSTSSPEDEVQHRKQWHVYMRYHCWNGEEITYFSAHPLQIGNGECGLTGCFPQFQAYQSQTATTHVWDGTATDRDFFVGFCRDVIVHHELWQAGKRYPNDLPCPQQTCSNQCYEWECNFGSSCYITGGTDYCLYPGSGCPPGEQANGSCCYWSSSPIVIDTSGNGFAMTDPAGGVHFPIGPTMVPYRVAWTASGSDDAWLALDRNGNGSIDNGGELFGNFTAQPAPRAGEEKHGFRALSVFDQRANGGNGDGRINSRDAVFAALRLWRDANHNGVSEANELTPLADSDVAAIDLNYRESRRVDQFGNVFRYRARVRRTQGSDVGRWAFDVFLTGHRVETHPTTEALRRTLEAPPMVEGRAPEDGMLAPLRRAALAPFAAGVSVCQPPSTGGPERVWNKAVSAPRTEGSRTGAAARH